MYIYPPRPPPRPHCQQHRLLSLVFVVGVFFVPSSRAEGFRCSLARVGVVGCARALHYLDTPKLLVSFLRVRVRVRVTIRVRCWGKEGRVARVFGRLVASAAAVTSKTQ